MPLLRNFISEKIESAQRRLASHTWEELHKNDALKVMEQLFKALPGYDVGSIGHGHAITVRDENGERTITPTIITNIRNRQQQKQAFQDINAIIASTQKIGDMEGQLPVRNAVKIKLFGPAGQGAQVVLKFTPTNAAEPYSYFTIRAWAADKSVQEKLGQIKGKNK